MRGINYSKYTLQPKEVVNFNQTAEFLSVLNSNGRLIVNLKNGGKLPMWSGVLYRPDALITEGFYLENPNAFEVTFELAWGFGDYRDQSLKVLNDIMTKEVPFIEATANSSEITITGNYDLGTPAGFVHILLQNTGTGTLRVGGLGGYKIEPDGILNLSYSGRLSLFGTSKIAVTFLKR